MAATAAVWLFILTGKWVALLVAALMVVVAVRRVHAAQRGARGRDIFLPDACLDTTAAVLASRLRSVYDREERLARIHDPVPLRVSWAEADPLFADHGTNILDGGDGPLDLTGELPGVANATSAPTPRPRSAECVTRPAPTGRAVSALAVHPGRMSARTSRRAGTSGGVQQGRGQWLIGGPCGALFVSRRG
ncbi:hypothetical protein [Streptomyces sp. TP-A0356]|uniref:hypothetical protein n=1 Tax=Streptomyces sp. TP-A0356 TaxID=1359208 RepID=UPI00131B0CCD|nr:hypothetical protein [Streptomyces sp. TP-A0356]